MISTSGGGVVPDVPLIPGGPLPEGYRFRVSLTENASEDIEVFIAGARLHVLGRYGTLHFDSVEANHVTIRVQLP